MSHRIAHDVAVPGLSLVIAVAIVVQVLLATAAFRRVDQFRDLWTCHAKAGYGHPELLDECLAGGQ